MYAVLTDYQGDTRNERRAYAGRILSLHRSRLDAYSCLVRLKTAYYRNGVSSTVALAIVAVVGSLPQVGEEVMHQKVLAVYIDGEGEQD